MVRNFFKRMLFRKEKPAFLNTRTLFGRETGNGTRISQDHQNDLGNIIRIDDLITQRWGSTNTAVYSDSSSGAVVGVGPSNSTQKQPEKKGDERKAVKPIEVFAELKKEDPGISFADLDEKVRVVKERIEVLSEHLDPSHLKDEQRALFFLENRRKYLKTKKKYPLDWAMTNQEAITDLCKRYKLRVVPLKQYYTLVPREGISEMVRYTAAYKKITGDEPIFELVIKDAEALPPEEKKEVRKKDRDPILLANSPFSSAMFVLGAWDDEVEVVDEIIYGAK